MGEKLESEGTRARTSGGCIEVLGHRLSLVKADDSHKAYIFATWTKSASRLVGDKTAPNSFWEYCPKTIEAIWHNTLVLTPDKTTIFGYICAQPDVSGIVLHYAYVVPELRHLGVTGRMIESMQPPVINPKGPRVVLTCPWPYSLKTNWTYNPYALIRGIHAKKGT